MALIPTFKDVKKDISNSCFVRKTERTSAYRIPFKNNIKSTVSTDIEDIDIEDENPIVSLYDLRSKLHDYIPLVIRELIGILLDPSTETKDRIRCIEQILNRYDGKPKERVEITALEKQDVSASEALDAIRTLYNTMPTGSKKVIFKNALKNSEKEFNNAH